VIISYFDIIKHYTIVHGEVMNTRDIADILGFDIEDVEIVVEVFKEEALMQMALLKQAIISNDFKSMANAAHSIKGSASNLHLDVIYESAKMIELSARDEKYIDYQAQYDTISTELNALES